MSYLTNPYRYAGVSSTLLWQQTSVGESEGLWSGGLIRAGQLFEAGHTVIDKTPTKFVFNLKKTESPSGNAVLNLVDDADPTNVKATFPLEDTGLPLVVDDLTESFVPTTFTNDANTVTIDADDRVVFYYSGDKYFYLERCASCAESNTQGTYYTGGAWTDSLTVLTTMEVWGY